jgi:hypothetical protein
MLWMKKEAAKIQQSNVQPKSEAMMLSLHLVNPPTLHTNTTQAHTYTHNVISHSELFNMVTEMGMGKSTKKKPLTKKERDERKKRRKESRPK